MQVRSEFKDEHKRVFMSLYQDYIVRIQKNLRAGIAQGIFREMDVEKTAEAMSAMTQGVLQSFYIREVNSAAAGQKREKLTDRTEAVCQLILEGIRKR
jgi:DNA-binding NarL/FixJ family response regulator